MNITKLAIVLIAVIYLQASCDLNPKNKVEKSKFMAGELADRDAIINYRKNFFINYITYKPAVYITEDTNITSKHFRLLCENFLKEYPNSTLKESVLKYQDSSYVYSKELYDRLIQQQLFDSVQNVVRRQEVIDWRKNYGPKLRDKFLDAGYDVTVKVTGKKYETIFLTFILFDAVWQRKLENDGVYTTLFEKGFRRVELSNGYDYIDVREH